ncbi:MAG: DUF177 domain-containing protein [Oligoflexia bacterium]|nr:DUF177 domain-containing protein [Oligoflexia bacterium]
MSHTLNSLNSQSSADATFTININSIKINQTIDIVGDHLQNPWILSILNEINDLEASSADASSSSPSLRVELSLSKHFGRDSEISGIPEYFIVQGNAEINYWSSCIRCLDPVSRQLYIDINACFVHQQLQNKPEYQEETIAFIENQERELYFINDNLIDIKEFLHEQIRLSIDDFPLHSDECKGLCQVCGENLNHKCCSHHQANHHQTTVGPEVS